MEPSRIDWDAIEIEPRWDEEGTEGVASEHGLYVKLGLQKEDEKGKKVRESRAKKRGVSTFKRGKSWCLVSKYVSVSTWCATLCNYERV